MTTPEEHAREIIDARLEESGWVVQSRDAVNITPGRVVIVYKSTTWCSRIGTAFLGDKTYPRKSAASLANKSNGATLGFEETQKE